MAKRIQAITAYRPRIDQGKAADEERYMELITQRTTLSSGVVKNVQDSEVESLIGLLLDGRPVHTGTAIYTLSIGLDGEYEVKSILIVGQRIYSNKCLGITKQNSVKGDKYVQSASVEASASWFCC